MKKKGWIWCRVGIGPFLLFFHLCGHPFCFFFCIEINGGEILSEFLCLCAYACVLGVFFSLLINMETERPMAKRHLFFLSLVPFCWFLPPSPLFDVSFLCFDESNLSGDRRTGI